MRKFKMGRRALVGAFTPGSYVTIHLNAATLIVIGMSARSRVLGGYLRVRCLLDCYP
jgi:hypothetical protein